MNKQFGNEDERLADFVSGLYQPEDGVLAEIRSRSVEQGLPDIHVAPFDGRHLEMLARLSGARKAVEIGTLGGYSGVCLLRGMGPLGFLHTIEVEARHAEVARESFHRAGLRDRVHIHIGMAGEVLPGLASEGPFDLVFIDADKDAYDGYLDWAERHLRPGGVLLADNAFLFGHLPGAGADQNRLDVQSMQRFHRRLASDGNWRATVLPTGEGLAVAIRN